MTAFMNSIQTLNHQGVPYRTLINANTIIVRYNEYGDDRTDEVYASNGTLLGIVDICDGSINIQGGACQC